MTKNIFICDVDGVITDSTDECLIVSWNAYQDVKKRKAFISSVEDADASFDKYFRSVRNYVRCMDEYLVVFESDFKITCQNDFYNALSSLDNEALYYYGKCFFRQRNKLRSFDIKSWVNLHKFYKGVIQSLVDIKRRYSLYIVTGKDKESVINIFDHFGFHVEPSLIYDKYSAKNKFASIQKIAEIESISLSKIWFLDDNVNHLLEPKKAGVNTLLASWGYVLDEHREIAKDNAVKEISLDSFVNFYKEDSYV